MFSEQVRLKIEALSQRMVTSSALLVRAKQGRVPPSVVHCYLRSVHYLISHTVPHLRAARAAAVERGYEQLEAYFHAKEREEAGHEEWAASDMRRLAQCFGEIGSVSPAPAIVGLVRYNERLIAADPRLYVAYMQCAEYITVLLGPVWIEALTRGCGVPVAALTVVSNHVEADAEHSREGFLAIDRFASSPELQPDVQRTLDAVFRYLVQFPEDLLRLCNAGAEDAPAVSADAP